MIDYDIMAFMAFILSHSITESGSEWMPLFGSTPWGVSPIPWPEVWTYFQAANDSPFLTVS